MISDNQVIPAHMICDWTSVSRRESLKRLAFSVFSQARELLTHKPNISEDKLPDYKSDVPTHRLYTPPYIVRSSNDSKRELLKCSRDSELICPVSERDHVLHVVYDVSYSWLTVVICDDQAELLEYLSVPFHSETCGSISTWLECLKLIWTPLLSLTSNTSFRWHVVIVKNGAITRNEQEAWKNLTKPYIDRLKSCLPNQPLPNDLAWRSLTLLALDHLQVSKPVRFYQMILDCSKWNFLSK